MSDATTMLAEAHALATQQKYLELEKLVGALLLESPDHAEAHNLLGVAFASTGRHALAIQSIARAHGLAPSHYGYARNLVRLLSNAQRYAEAQEIGRRFAEAGYPKSDDLTSFVARVTGQVDAKATDVFEEIYRNNAWSAGSGLGSTEQATRIYRAFLEQFMRANRIRSVVDLGCGDWQFARLIDWTGIRYIGLDASTTALGMAKRVAPASFEFRQFDAFSESLPEADLLIVKDVLQHWPSAEIVKFLTQTDRFRFSLITNGYAPSPSLNTDIDLGNFRPLDLTAPPFNAHGANVLSFQAGDFKMTLLRQGRA